MALNRHAQDMRIILQIEDVDLANRQVHARDKHGVVQIANFRDSAGLLRIPTAGELWQARRNGYDWHLEKKWDSADEHDSMVANMSPGDSRLSSPGAMQIESQSAYINQRPVGATIRDLFQSDSSFTEVTLTTEPIGIDSIHPTLNGLAIPPNLWTYDTATRVLTFTAPMAVGNLLVTYQTWRVNMDDAGTVTGRAIISAVEQFIDGLLPEGLAHTRAQGSPTI